MATLRDVAREAGLNVSTVSRVLNNRGYISEEARARVDSAMKKLHYRPNEIARSLRTQNSGLIGVIVPRLSHPYYASSLHWLMKRFDSADYHMLLFDSENNNDKLWQYLQYCESYHVDAVVLMSNLIKMDKKKEFSFPLITVERERGWADALVQCDNLNGGRMAAEHLYERGCRNLIQIAGANIPGIPSDRRMTGFIEMCDRLHVKHREFSTDEYQFDSGDYLRFIADILRRFPDTDGVFASSDMIAMNVEKAAKQLGLSVPDDLKIVGFDDTKIAEYAEPPITSIHQDLPAMMSTVVELLPKLIAGEEVQKETTIPVKLVKRGST
jgi:LacI family sucrose operon transcriptional repressor